MARVALIKLFTGLNLGVSQLSGELQRAGHDTRIVYFKDFLCVPVEDSARYLVSDYAGVNVAARGREYVFNCYTPISEREYELLFEVLDEFRPDLVGFSLTSLTMKPAAEVTARIRTHLGVPVIWGGAGPTIDPDASLQHADFVCINEGERVITELAARIDRGADCAGIPGLWMKRNGDVIRTPAGPLLELNDIAVPDFEPARTVHVNDGQLRRNVYPHNLGVQYPIMTQRGCPFSCSFCIESVYQDMFGKQHSLRRRSVDAVIAELVAARRTLGVRQVMFYDDVFTVNPRWLQEFAARYKAEVSLPFWCYTYPTTTRREDILLLKDAGLRSITMGIQSGSEEILEKFHRPVANQRTIEAARVIIDCGVECFFDLITKVQFEDEAHCRQTFELLLALPVQVRTVGFGAMTLFPHYGYTARVAEVSRQSSVSEADYRYFHKLYLLTRTELPRWAVRALGRSRLVRRFPALLDPLLPERLPMMFLDDEPGEFAGEILDLPHAQAVIPGGRLDRGLPGEAGLGA